MVEIFLGIIKQSAALSTIRGVGRILKEDKSYWKLLWFLAFLLFQSIAIYMCHLSIVKYLKFEVDIVQKYDFENVPHSVIILCPKRENHEKVHELMRHYHNVSMNSFFNTFGNQENGWRLRRLFENFIMRSYNNFNSIKPHPEFSVVECDFTYRTKLGAFKRECKTNEIVQIGNCIAIKIEENHKMVAKFTNLIIYFHKAYSGLYYLISPNDMFPIHSPLYSSWKDMKAGVSSHSYVNTKMQKNLPYPYSNCQDDVQKDVCMHKCLSEDIIDICRCISAEVVYNGLQKNSTLPDCAYVAQKMTVLRDQLLCVKEVLNSEIQKDHCEMKCPNNCEEVSYTSTDSWEGYVQRLHHALSIVYFYENVIMERSYAENFKLVKEFYDLYNNQQINLSMHSVLLEEVTKKLNSHFGFIHVSQPAASVKVYFARPSFDLPMLMYAIGGTMCLWGGVTVYALVELVQLVIQLSAHICTQYKHNQTSDQKITTTKL